MDNFIPIEIVKDRLRLGTASNMASSTRCSALSLDTMPTRIAKGERSGAPILLGSEQALLPIGSNAILGRSF